MADNSSYDFIVNDEDEVMLLLYAGNTKPEKSKIILNHADKSAELQRNENETIVLEEIPEDVFDSLIDADTLLVCELADSKTDEENNLVYAYEAEIED